MREHRDRLESTDRRSEEPETIGPVAQLGERLVCIQEVVGSIPVGSTIACWEHELGAYSSVWLERTPDKREVGGSNPPRPTRLEVLRAARFPKESAAAQETRPARGRGWDPERKRAAGQLGTRLS